MFEWLKKTKKLLFQICIPNESGSKQILVILWYLTNFALIKITANEISVLVKYWFYTENICNAISLLLKCWLYIEIFATKHKY